MTVEKISIIVLDEFYQYLSGILGHYKNLIPILKDELKCILSNEVTLLDENLKEQQVLLIQTKDFDSRVHYFSSRLQIDAKNLTELTLQLEKDQQLRFFDLLADFDTTFTQVNFYKEKCRTILQSKLYTIENLLSLQESYKDMPTYDKNAAEVQGGLFPKSFEKKI